MQLRLIFLSLASQGISFPLLPGVPLDKLPTTKVARNLASSTQNDLVGGSSCKALTTIYARGTKTPGNVGESPGLEFVQAIANLIGSNNIAVQGVEYPATPATFMHGGDRTGAALMANLTTQAVAQCPDSKIVLGGYSQGGQLVHMAAKQLDSAVASQISSVVIFGDPMNGTAVENIDPSKVLIICHAQDDICQGERLPVHLEEHVNYEKDTGNAAKFVVRAAGL